MKSLLQNKDSIHTETRQGDLRIAVTRKRKYQLEIYIVLVIPKRKEKGKTVKTNFKVVEKIEY